MKHWNIMKRTCMTVIIKSQVKLKSTSCWIKKINWPKFYCECVSIWGYLYKMYDFKSFLYQNRGCPIKSMWRTYLFITVEFLNGGIPEPYITQCSTTLFFCPKFIFWRTKIARDYNFCLFSSISTIFVWMARIFVKNSEKLQNRLKSEIRGRIQHYRW